MMQKIVPPGYASASQQMRDSDAARHNMQRDPMIQGAIRAFSRIQRALQMAWDKYVEQQGMHDSSPRLEKDH